MESSTITNLDWFKQALSEFGETLDDIEKISLSDREMNNPVSMGSGEVMGFGFGFSCGREFLAWSKDYVYFEVCYDGHYSEIRRVPRNPI
jgi:hypothetical protein